MPLNIIAAVGKEAGVIGTNGGLPWPKIPSDMKFFKEITMGYPVVMGRKTWDSMPETCRPLSGRRNIVLTRNAFSIKLNKGSVDIFESVEPILEMTKTEEVFVVGGAEIYRLFMPYTERIYMTLVHGDFKGDTYFPEISYHEWRLAHANFVPDYEGNSHALDFRLYLRKRSPTR